MFQKSVPKITDVVIIAQSPTSKVSPVSVRNLSSMLRIFLTVMLMCASAVAQLVPVPRNQQPTSQVPMALPEQPSFHPERVKPDTVVIEIQGICSGVGEGAAKASPCVTQITKDQFL